MSLLTQKYNYTPINRTEQEGKRLYTTPTGDRVPSVTTILSHTQPPEKRAALQAWRQRVGPAKAQEITVEASSRGTRMHKFLERYILEGQLPDPGSNPFSHQSHKMAKSIIDNEFNNINEIWGVEIGLYYPELYAGTCDSCGVYKTEDSIFDYKQSNKTKLREYIDDYMLQLVSYALCHNKLYGTKIRKGVILMSVKPPEITPGRWGDPQHQTFIIEGDEFDRYVDLWWNRVEQFYLAN